MSRGCIIPGFQVSGVGAGVQGQPKVYLTYTWSIDNLFGTNIGDGDATVVLQSMTLPAFTVGKETVQGSALNYKFAKSVEWDDVKVVWYDTAGLLSVISKWRKSVWTQAGGLAHANQYKKNSKLNTFLPDGSSQNAWSLTGSWPTTIRYGDLTYVQSDAKTVAVDVTYDWAEEKPG